MHFKLTIILMFTSLISFDIKDIYLIRTVLDSSRDCRPKILNAVDALSFLIFAVFHWTFCSHYLKVACLFRLAFQQRTLRDAEIMRKIKLVLRLVDVIFYLFSAAFFTVAVLFSEMGILLLTMYWTVSVWIIFLMSFFSTRKINKYTKRLDSELGIVTKERFMLFYNCCFFIAAFFDTLLFVMVVLSFSEDSPCPEQIYENYDDRSLRIMIVNYSFQIVQSVAFFCAHVMMLIMLAKYNKHLNAYRMQQLIKNFTLVFSSNQDSLPLSRGDSQMQNSTGEDLPMDFEERRAIAKKLSFWREVADSMIDDVIATIMTISSQS